MKGLRHTWVKLKTCLLLDHMMQDLAARIRGHAAALRSYLAEISEDISIAMPLIEEALECLPDEDIRLRAFVTIRHANCLNWIGEFERSIPAYKEAGRIGKQIGDAQMAITALSEAAVTQTVIGRLRQSVQEMDELVGYANSLSLRDGRKPPAMGILNRHKSLIHYEKNELQEAEASCREAIAICKQWGEKESLQHAHYRLTLTLFAVGDRPQAEKEMERCFSLARSISPAAESSISILKQHSLLLQGETSRNGSLGAGI